MGRMSFEEFEGYLGAAELTKADAARLLGVTTQTINGWRARKQVSADASDDVRRILSSFVSGAGKSHQTSKILAEMRADQVQIPQLNVTGSMGAGALAPDHADVVQFVGVRVSELRKQCSFTSPQNLQIITGFGRSMAPTFADGDPLLIDTGVKSVEIDAIYVFSIGKDLFIKGLQRIPGGGLRVISHNREEFDSYTLTVPQMEHMDVHGRVVLAWNARRL